MTNYRSKKREAGNYEVVSSDGTVVATIVLTGRPGVDNYPWDYAIVDERAADHGRMFGVTDTKAAALDKIRTMLAAADNEVAA